LGHIFDALLRCSPVQAIAARNMSKDIAIGIDLGASA
jgi:hypothetical protein